MAGGSRKATNGDRDDRSNAASEGNSSSMSTVNVFDCSRSSCRRRRPGRRRFVFTKLTHQTTPSTSNVAGSSVAKCGATSGEYVQSSSRVGSPRCCASASHSHNVSAPAASPCAYLRKLRSSASSSRGMSRDRAPSLSSALVRRCSIDGKPRNAKLDRYRCRAEFHEPAYNASSISSQLCTDRSHRAA